MSTSLKAPGLPQIDQAPEPMGHPGPLRVWLLAIRPKTLSAGAVPVMVGSALAFAADAFSLGPALAALAGALLLQVGSNLANDVFDFLKGADTDSRIGPARAAQKGWLSPRQLLGGTAVVFLLATLCGLYLTATAGWPVIAIGTAGMAAAVGYTAGRRPLGYRGLGDALVFIFFGPVAVGGTFFVQAGPPTAVVWLGSVSVGLLATAILVVNNLRDRETDAEAGKLTLAVRLGARGARLEYALCLAAALAMTTLVPLTGLGGPGWLLPLLAAPLFLARWRAISCLDGPALNPELGATARLGLVHGMLLAVGVLL